MNTPRGETEHPTATVWAVGSGKGGIGKSFISSNLAICLTRMGKSVTVIDLDLGGANLHTCFGVNSPQKSISDFISGRVSDLSSLAVETGIPGVQLISGFADDLNVTELSPEARERIIAETRKLSTPYVILDLGAGTNEHTLDFFLSADQKIIAVTPEPTSIENAYRFIKAAFYRKLRQVERHHEIRDLIESVMNNRSQNGIRSPADLLRHLMAESPEAGSKLMADLMGFQLQIVLNQVRSREDIDLGHSMRSVCRKYFGVEAKYLGYLDHDNAAWRSLRKRKPLIVEFPYSSIVGQFLGITKNLLNPQSLRAVV